MASLGTPPAFSSVCSSSPLTSMSSKPGSSKPRSASTSRAKKTRRFGIQALGLQALLFSICLVLGLICVPTDSHAQNLGGGFRLELGEAFVPPGQSYANVPVYLTNPDPVTSWEMGLDYDEFMLSLVAVTFVGTESEPLNPGLQTSPPSPPLSWLRVEYSSQTPMPPGANRLVAYLVFNVTMPQNQSIALPVDIFGTETIINGGVVPEVGSGFLTIFVGDLLRVGSAEGNLIGPVTYPNSTQWFEPNYTPTLPPMLIPIEIWNDDPVDTLLLGLDYDEFLMVGIDFNQTIVQSVAGEDFDVVITDIPQTGHLISVDLLGQTIPPGSAQVVGWLVAIPEPAAAGTFNIAPSPSLTMFGMDNVANLLAGEVTIRDEFVRGDATYDGQVNIADATTMLEFLFQSVEPACREALDANGDGQDDIADPVYLLTYLFVNGPQPAEPFPMPGIDVDPTDDNLPCLSGP